MPRVRAAVRPSQLRVALNEHTADVINTGHALQVNLPGGDRLSVGDEEYELLQFHLHTPSEHTVKGVRFPMEAHFVHRGREGHLAVVAVLFRNGRANPAIAHLLEWLPRERGVEYHHEHVVLDGRHMLPKDHTTYRYDGSLTTPPCSEGVRWVVFATPLEAAPAQIAAIARLTGSNSRPTQPLQGRAVLTETVATPTTP
jgi:carbonic anhydrase